MRRKLVVLFGLLLCCICFYSLNVGAAGNDVRLEFILADSTYRPSPYDDDGNLVEGYRAGTYFDDMEQDYAYLVQLDEKSNTSVLLDGAEFELKYWYYGQPSVTLTCVSGGVDAKGVPLAKGRIAFYVPDDVFGWTLSLVSCDGYDTRTFCWHDDFGYMEMVSYDGRDPEPYMSDVDSCLRYRSYSGDICADRSWPQDMAASICVGPVWHAYSGISTYGGGNDGDIRAYTGSVLWADAFASDSDFVELKFIKADSRGKPPKSFADGSRIEDVVTEGDMFEELGTEGPSYEWLDDHGFLVDGCLFGLKYWYRDADGKLIVGKQACWSGGSSCAQTDWGDFVSSYVYSEWVGCINDTANYEGLGSGELKFDLPVTTGKWELIEIYSPSGYSHGSFARYTDAGVLCEDFVNDPDENVIYACLYGHDYDSELDSWQTGMLFVSTIDEYGTTDSSFVERNPGFVSSRASGSEFVIPYTGNILWNDEKTIELSFIKADARGKTPRSFADGSTYTDDGQYVPGLTYDELYERGYLLNGTLIGLDYTYLDSNGMRKSGRQACWSGGVVLKDNLADWRQDWFNVVVPYDDLREGEVRFVLPETTYSWTLYEPCALPGYDEYSYMFYADQGIIGGAGDEMPAGYSVSGRDYDPESNTWDMYFSYNVDGSWGFSGVYFTELNPFHVGVETYGGADNYYSESMFLRTIDGSGSVLWNAFDFDSVLKIEFIKANAKYRPSPYDNDGNLVDDYHAGTFYAGDVSDDYAYLKDLDDDHGDVFVDGCKFRLDYENCYGGTGSLFCWSGGKDDSGALVDDGRDLAHDIIDRGKVVFYIPNNVVSWSLYELSAPLDYLDLQRGYGETFIGKYDDLGYYGSVPVEGSHIKGVWDDDCDDWSMTSYVNDWTNEHDGDSAFDRVDYSGVSTFSSGFICEPVERPYTGHILWNDRFEIFSKTPDYTMGGSGYMTLTFTIPCLLEYSSESSFVIHDKMGDGMTMSDVMKASICTSVGSYSSGSRMTQTLRIGSDIEYGLQLVKDPDDGCSFHIVTQDLWGPWNEKLYNRKYPALKNYYSGYIGFDTDSELKIGYSVSLANDADVADNVAWVEVLSDDGTYATSPVRSRMRNITLSVHKTDVNGADLPGAEFMLQKLYYGRDGHEDPEWCDVRSLEISDDDSRFYVGGLSEGVYRIVESVVPDDYEVMDPVCFYLDVSDDGELSISYELVEIAWSRYDVPFDCDGFYSTNGSKYYYDDSSDGLMLLGERDTMYTYFKSYSYSNVFNVSVSDDNIEMDVVNYEATYPQMPETGGRGIAWFMIAGPLFVLVGCALLKRKK